MIVHYIISCHITYHYCYYYFLHAVHPGRSRRPLAGAPPEEPIPEAKSQLWESAGLACLLAYYVT